MVLALKVNDKDNVATIFAEQVQGGDVIQIRDKKGRDNRGEGTGGGSLRTQDCAAGYCEGADYCKIRRRDRNGFR